MEGGQRTIWRDSSDSVVTETLNDLIPAGIPKLFLLLMRMGEWRGQKRSKRMEPCLFPNWTLMTFSFPSVGESLSPERQTLPL